jgi:hypothetical protein
VNELCWEFLLKREIPRTKNNKEHNYIREDRCSFFSHVVLFPLKLNKQSTCPALFDDCIDRGIHRFLYSVRLGNIVITCAPTYSLVEEIRNVHSPLVAKLFRDRLSIGDIINNGDNITESIKKQILQLD